MSKKMKETWNWDSVSWLLKMAREGNLDVGITLLHEK
jgi:hypothetical protein